MEHIHVRPYSQSVLGLRGRETKTVSGGGGGGGGGGEEGKKMGEEQEG